MKKITFLIICMTFSNAVQSQSPDWLWANSAGGTINEYANAVTTDASGNIIAVGGFSSISCNFGSTILTPGGGADMFIVKYDPAGNILWVKSAGGALNDGATSVTTDASGNIFAAGFFHSDSIIFGATTLINASGNNCSGLCNDIFIVKYDAAGNILWAKSAGGNNFDEVRSVTIDAAGNIIIAGAFSSTSITFGNTTLTNTGGGYHVYTAKYNAAGNPLWAKSASGTLSNSGFATVDDSGNIIVSGHFYSPTLTFDSTTLINSGGSDFFIAKYDTAGILLWARSAGGNYTDIGRSVTADASGNIIALGLFNSPSITFGSYTIPGVSSSYRTFIVKYDPSGNVLWANSFIGPGPNPPSAYFLGNVLVAGFFSTPAITIGSTTFTNSDTLLGTADVYIVNYDTSGNVLWAKTVGGTKNDVPSFIAVDALGSIIVLGNFSSPTINFDATTLTNANPGGGSQDLFIAKLDTLLLGGINDISASLNVMRIYPNPFSDFTTIKFDDFVSDATLIVYNIYGQQVRQQKNVTGHTFTFLRDNLPAGLYFMQQIQDNQIISSVKLIIIE